ncbi:secretory carrier membrane protein isoform X3 [Rhodnius prolixus]|uniref:secretory carrier membrane protein isoform X3 n=1 Tax=Rhodnius prolixus TaxID=13249 RepID=UPI003D188C22
MSGFDDNPFGPPTVDNPFADPAVQQVTKQTSSVQRGLEEFNPFADQPSQPTPSATRTNAQPAEYNARQTQPAVMTATQEEPAAPTYNRNAQQPSNMTAADFQAALNRRQEELERKAAELQRREDELRNASYNVRRNNWPPLPENCCGLEPCFYQDINIEIPIDFQSVVRHLYYLWIFHTLLMLANVFGAVLLAAVYGNFGMLGVSILYALLFTPFSFLCWYRPGYKAFRNDSSFNFMVFFFIFFFQFVVTVIQAIGVPGGGTCGVIIALKCFDSSVSGIITGLIILSIACGYCIAAVLDLLLITKIHRIYRSTGASMAKAQAEFTTEFLKNEHVRDAASTAATAAVQAQFQAARTPPSRY